MRRATEKNEKKPYIAMAGIALFTAILILPALSWGILSLISVAAPSVMERLNYDTGENRLPAQLPEDWQLATLSSDLEACYNDRVPFRSVLLSANKKINNCLEDTYSDKIQPVFLSWVNRAEAQDAAAAKNYIPLKRLIRDVSAVSDISMQCRNDLLPGAGQEEVPPEEPPGEEEPDPPPEVDTSYFPPRLINDIVIVGRNDWLFYAGNNSVAYYQGTNVLSDEKMAETLSLMQELQDICYERDILLQFMILPNKEQVYSEYMPSYNVEQTYKRIPQFIDYVRENSAVSIIYPYAELLEGKALYQMYYQFDTHWTLAGAYIGTQALYQALGLPTTDLASLEVVPAPRPACDLINLAGYDPSLAEKEHDYFVAYHLDNVLTLDQGDRHMENPLYTENASATNDCNIVLLGDSFRLGMVPYIEKDFNRCTFAHVSHLDNTALYPDLYNTDILVIELVERNDTKLNSTLRSLIGIYNDQYE